MSTYSIVRSRVPGASWTTEDDSYQEPFIIIIFFFFFSLFQKKFQDNVFLKHCIFCARQIQNNLKLKLKHFNINNIYFNMCIFILLKYIFFYFINVILN